MTWLVASLVCLSLAACAQGESKPVPAKPLSAGYAAAEGQRFAMASLRCSKSPPNSQRWTGDSARSRVQTSWGTPFVP